METRKTRKTIWQIFIALLLINQSFGQQMESLKNSQLNDEISTENYIKENKKIEEEVDAKNTLMKITDTHMNSQHQTFHTEVPKAVVNSTESKDAYSDEMINTTTEKEVCTKSLVTLEDYAIKQVNFILDHILLESQEFVAKVLQATVNIVFQRDHLKRYAENLNRILNSNNDYSDEESTDKPLLTSQKNDDDDLYEGIMIKINFLKSKSTKHLQRHLPQDWIEEYKNKRMEIIVWLDKATEELRKEFNRYGSDEQDHLKYQYFNEAFDDVSRATEIHQKLALLADLIEIVKNKKQITFMDLYMQT